MKHMKTDTLYQQAVEADDAFEAAIKKQFGINANRFGQSARKYNAETKAAYNAKVNADEIWLSSINTN